MSKSENRSRRREQRLLDEVLVRAGSERRRPTLLIFRKDLSHPGHGPVEVVQVQIADTPDGVVVFPLLGGTIAAGGEEPMQRGKEDGRLDGKLEAPVCQQGRQDLVDCAVLPESLENHVRPDPGAVSGDAVAPRTGAEDGQFFGEPPKRLDQRVKLAAGQQLIQPAETKHDS